MRHGLGKWIFSALLVLSCILLMAQAHDYIHVQVGASADPELGAIPVVKTSLTTSVNVKASVGLVYGVFALNGAASACWVQFINSSGAGTLGTGVVFSIPLPASTTQPVWLPFQPPVGGFGQGIAVGIATTAGGASACGTAGNVVVLYR